MPSRGDSLELFRGVFEAALDALLLADDRGVYVDANPAACALFGISRDELIGRSAADFVSGSFDPTVAWSTFLAAGRLQGRFPLQRPDGTRRELDFCAVAHVVPGIHLSILRDVTERVDAEAVVQRQQERLNEDEARFRAMIEKSDDIVLRTNAIGLIEYASPAIERLLGRSAEEVLGRTMQHLMHPDDAAMIAERRAQVHAGVQVAGSKFRMQHADGSYRWFFGAARNLIHDPHVRGLVINLRDITAQKHAEEAMRASEQRYRRIIESTSEGVWMIDADTLTTFANTHLADMLGYTVEEMLGRSSLDFVDPEQQGLGPELLERRRRGIAERRLVKLRHKGGGTCWASIQSNPLTDAKGAFEGVLGMVTDVTPQREVEEMSARLAAIVESSDDAILSGSLDGIVTSWNLGATRLYQYAAAEIIGRPKSVLCPSDREEEWRDILARAEAGESLHQFETVRVRKDGTPVEVSLTVSPIRDLAGRISGVSVIARDLTAQRGTEAALRRGEEQLRQALKMEAVGRLAGGIAHDFNNLLTVILGSARMLLDDDTPVAESRIELEEIAQAGARAVDLTRQLLAFSRQQVLQPRALDLNLTLSGLATMFRRLLGEGIHLSIVTPQKLGTVLADPGQIEQVLVNLVVNARDAMVDGGSLTIETANVVLDEDLCASHAGLVPGDYVVLVVSDTGGGMDAATQARVFEPFFTTKELGKGTGLGLATVFGIVKQSGGHVALQSAPGRGATFKVFLPRVGVAAAVVEPVRPARISLQGSETILLVEDEDQVRVLLRTWLRRAGYHVLEAQNGGEAFLTCEQHAGDIHLLLTDLVMPRLSGRQLADRLSGLRPAMKVLYMSGYTDDAVIRHGGGVPGSAFLQKPIMPVDLLSRVRESLESRV